MSMIRAAAAFVLAASVALPAVAQGIPKASSPEEVGFVATRLKRLSERLEEGVRKNELPGAVVLIARNGKIAMFESFGYRDKETKAPMTNDAIFRIASMTKPIVTVAAIILMEEGKDMWRFEAMEPSARMGQGFGLGFAVRTEQGRNPLPGSPGDYYWGGAYGTYFWHDPRERMYVVFMMQSPVARLRYRYLMRDLVYQALIGN